MTSFMGICCYFWPPLDFDLLLTAPTLTSCLSRHTGLIEISFSKPGIDRMLPREIKWQATLYPCFPLSLLFINFFYVWYRNSKTPCSPLPNSCWETGSIHEKERGEVTEMTFLFFSSVLHIRLFWFLLGLRPVFKAAFSFM